MDILSDAITVMRTGTPASARVTWHAPFGQRFAPVAGAAGFHVVVQGSCWLTPEDGTPIPLATGDVVLLARGRGHTLTDSPTTTATTQACHPDDPHTIRPEPRPGPATTVTLCGAYRLDPARAHPLLLDLPELLHLPARLGGHPETRAAVDLLGAELERPRLGTDALIPALLDTLLLYLLRTWIDDQDTRGTTTGWAAALADPPTTAALHAIHREPARPWTVAALAAEAGMSRAPFARRFHTLVGRPPLAYLTWWRMTTAARLLRDTDAPLAAIARKTGYGSEFAFAAAFKRHHGIAPGRFRRAENS